MLWFFIATLGYLLLAINFVLDKIIVSKSVSNPVVYTFYSTIFMVGVLLALPLIDFDILHGVDWIWAGVSGIGFGLGLWTVYKALSFGETSHINPFNGVVISLFTFIFASFFLSEHLNTVQTVGLILLGIASLLLSAEKSHEHSGFHIGFVWALISGILFAISHTAAKYLYIEYPFWTAFIWSRSFIAVVGFFALCFPSVWKSFISGKKDNASKEYQKKHAVGLIVTNKVISIVQVVILQFAMFVGSVTLVNAVMGLQYVFMFIIILVLTNFFPHILKEYFTRKELITEIIAIVLVVVGSALCVIPL